MYVLLWNLTDFSPPKQINKQKIFDELMYTIKLKEKYSYLTTKTFKALQGLDVAATRKKISILKFLIHLQIEP
jgi:hypothetical protein